VCVVAVVDEAVVLIRQFRAPVDAMMLELPAGKLDIPGEPPERTAARELEEETGYRPGRLELIASFYTGPGFTDEHMRVFLATDCTPTAPHPHGPEEEAAEIVHVPIAELPALAASGEVADAKTLVGLLSLLHRGA